MSQVITISITGTAAECRSAMAELLGTAAPVAVVAAAPAAAAAPVVDDGKKKKKNETPAPTVGQPVVDPFAAAPATPASTAPASTPEAGAQVSASGPTATTAASPSEGEVTYDELKKLMTDVLSKKSAAFALDALQKATGHKALTGMPKEMYPKAKAALEAALV